MQAHVVTITQPDLFFVRSKTNSMTGITMSSYRTGQPSLHGHTCQLFSCFQIAYFKSKQAVDSNKCEALLTVDRKRTDTISEWTYFFYNSMRFRISYMQQGR